MRKQDRKELEKSLAEMANEPPRNRKQKALDELEKIGKDCPNIRFIIEMYPDYDCVWLHLGDKKCFDVFLSLSQHFLKDEPKAVKRIVRTMSKNAKDYEKVNNL